MSDGYRNLVLSTDQASLYCTIEDGRAFLEYFTMSDLYSTYRVALEYEDLCEICRFLEKWGSESVEIIQPYSTTVNGHPSFCAVRFEYTKNEDDNCIRGTLQKLTFYAECWGEDIEDSLKNEKFLSWSYWTDYYNWDEFQKLRAFLREIRSLMARYLDVGE